MSSLSFFIASHSSLQPLAGKALETPPETAAAGVLANEYFPGKGGANKDYPETGAVDNDPDHIVAKSLLCFDQKQVSYLSTRRSKFEINIFLQEAYELFIRTSNKPS